MGNEHNTITDDIAQSIPDITFNHIVSLLIKITLSREENDKERVKGIKVNV